MIVDKKTGKVTSANATSVTAKPSVDTDDVKKEVIQVPTGGIVDAFKAIKEILSNVRIRYGDNSSPKIFNRVYHNDGQFERICRKGRNAEDGIAFPACFVHFIDVHWLKPSSKKTEGRATLRIQFILDRLNVHDSTETEVEGYVVAERIKQEIALHKDEYKALQKRCALDYIYKLESFDNGLQAWWMVYEVWFTETNIWYERNIKRVNLVFPPFVNHSDQTDPKQNRFNHTNENHQVPYDTSSKFVYSGIIPKDQSDNETDNTDNGDDDTENSGS